MHVCVWHNRSTRDWFITNPVLDTISNHLNDFHLCHRGLLSLKQLLPHWAYLIDILHRMLTKKKKSISDCDMGEGKEALYGFLRKEEPRILAYLNDIKGTYSLNQQPNKRLRSRFLRLSSQRYQFCVSPLIASIQLHQIRPILSYYAFLY